MTDARAWLDAVDAIHNQVIRNNERAEWIRLTTEHDALPAATTALRAVLDLHADDGYGDCTECGVDTYENAISHPCPTVTAITTALEDA